MAIGVYFHSQAFTLEQYQELQAALEAAGHAEPEGRLQHASFGPEHALMMFEVWESREALDAYGPAFFQTLMELGSDPGHPMVMPVHDFKR